MAGEASWRMRVGPVVSRVEKEKRHDFVAKRASATRDSSEGPCSSSSGRCSCCKNFGYVHAGRIVDYWPLLLVWVGATRILAPKRGRHVVSGAILVLLGALLLADRFDWMDLSMRDFWPMACVIAGFAMIAEGLFARKRDARRHRRPVVTDRSPQLAGRFVAGAILIVLGVLFLLDNFGCRGRAGGSSLLAPAS